MVSKSAFDGAGRTTASYITDGGGDSGYSDADDVTGDNVLTEMDYTYDADGNVTLAASRDRFHDETGTGASARRRRGVLARVSYSASYYDLANRLTDSVDVGGTSREPAGQSVQRQAASVGRHAGDVLLFRFASRGLRCGEGRGRPGQPVWTAEAGGAGWYLYDIASNQIAEDPTRIVDIIRSKPDTPQRGLAATQGEPAA